MGKRFLGKVAIVTGASKGIGAAIAEDLALEGASVVVNYAKAKEGADKVVETIVKNGGKAIACQANIANQKDIDKLFAETKKSFGKLDILINNAGIYEFAPLEEITAESFHKQFDLNVLGLILCCQAALKYFPSAGGSIVNISSIASTSNMPSSAVYSATKAAVDAVTRILAAELGPRKIRVNAVNPGLIQTEGTTTSGIISAMEENYASKAHLRRIGFPKDIASAVSFLASDEASWITGETLYITGGLR